MEFTKTALDFLIWAIRSVFNEFNWDIYGEKDLGGVKCYVSRSIQEVNLAVSHAKLIIHIILKLLNILTKTSVV